MRAWLFLLSQELTLLWRQGSQLPIVLGFYTLSALLIFWISGYSLESFIPFVSGFLLLLSIFAVFLSFDTLFTDDFHNGMIEIWVLSPFSLPCMVAIKVLAYWFLIGLPLSLLAPFFHWAFGLTTLSYISCFMIYALCSLTLCFIGALGSALLLGSHRYKGLVFLLVLPLYIPIFICGIMAFENPNYMNMYELILGGSLMIQAPLSCLGAAFGLRIAISE
jgi:heme exporter protein B